MAKRRVIAGRRSLIALALVGFVSVATGVIARRVYGVREQREIRKLQRARDALITERIRWRRHPRRVEPSPAATDCRKRSNMHIPKPTSW
jgi:hypothetical protein